MKFLYTLFVSCLISSSLQAYGKSVDWRGTVVKENNRLFLKLKSDKKQYQIVPENSVVSKTLRILNSGDSLECSGFVVNADRSRIIVDLVHFVGLKEMLGVWRNRRKVLYEFVDFDSVTLYEKPRSNTLDSEFQRIKTYQYTVTPSSEGNWSILINDNKTISTGNLIVESNRLTIEMIDSQTGKVENSLSLQRAY